jgi:hypothetical protein
MKKDKTYNHTFPMGSYGWSGMDPKDFAKNLRAASRRFKEIRTQHEFQAIAFSGSSGCAIGFTLGLIHKIPLIYVRKDKEESHGRSVEYNGSEEVKNYLIVDDFICTGATVRKIIDKIDKFAKNAEVYPATPCAVLCFDTMQLPSLLDKPSKVKISAPNRRKKFIPVYSPGL